MSEIRIIHQQIQRSLDNSVTHPRATDKFIENLRVGQVLEAQLVKVDNKYWLMIESIKLPIRKEIVVQLGLQENQAIRMKVRSKAEPVELQIIKTKSKNAEQAKQPAIINSRLVAGQNQTNVSGRNNSSIATNAGANTGVVAGNKVVQQEQSTRTNSEGKQLKNNLTAADKNNADKLIHEARKFLSKTIAAPILSSAESTKPDVAASTKASTTHGNTAKAKSNGTINPKTGVTPSQSTGQQSKTTVASNNAISDSMRNLISQSRANSVITAKAVIQNEQSTTTKLNTVNPNLIQQPTTKAVQPETKANLNTMRAVATPIKSEQAATKSEQSTGKAEQSTIKAERSTIKAEQSTIKAERSTIKAERSTTKAERSTIKAEQSTIKAERSTIKAEQSTIKAEQTAVKGEKHINRTEQVALKGEQVVTKQKTTTGKNDSKAHLSTPGTSSNRVMPENKPINLERAKLEVSVNLPDKDKFPLLSEKLAHAYQRLLPAQQTNAKSINNLFSQLQRLNQYSLNKKSTRGATTSTQSVKLAADLKESLKDLFRYISHKDNLKSGKSIEKALRQSGTFLEKRNRIVQESTKQQNTKTSVEPTLHKDLKANLNRVLATALYNLAKINTTKPSTTTTTTTSTTTGSNPTTGTEKSSPGLARQLSGNTSASGNNLIQNIRNQLSSFKGASARADFMPELEKITKEVLKNVQSAIFRSQLGQLTNLRPESAPQQWVFELPVMNNKEIDLFFVQFKEHETKDDDEKGKKGWSLILQFDIFPLGKIRAMLTWAENKVNIKFLAEQRATVDLVNNELKHFQNILSDQGLKFEELSVEHTLLNDMNINFSKVRTNG